MSKSKVMNAVGEVAAEETSAVKKDMLQTVAVNLLFVLLLIALYFWNKSAGYPLDSWVSRLIQI